MFGKSVLAASILLLSFHVRAQMNLGQLISGKASFDIPFTQTIAEIPAKATIKGTEYAFMLDSGAPLFISAELQEKYNYPILYKSRTQDATGKIIKTVIVTIDTIGFGPFVFTGIPAIVVDMKGTPLECLKFSGNIGSNLLRFLYVNFNSAKKTVSFTNDRQQIPNPNARFQKMRVTHQGDVEIAMPLDDDIIDTVQFDSGDGRIYSIALPKMQQYASRHNCITHKGMGVTGQGIAGIGEDEQQYIMRPETITVGAAEIPTPVTVVAGNGRSRVGRDLLNYGVLQLNYPDSTFSFHPYSASASPTRYDFGFIPVMDGDVMIAGCVWDSSDALKQGMRSGDRILKIDDMEFTKMDKCAITGLTRQLPLTNKQIKVLFRHKKQQPQTIVLQPKRL